ncbi:hypothetical protein, partial [Microbulbifer sp. 2205BS26-8]|uniref:hypothetical protein n=1 Tax=Microbulbifer sp. 2205BS26-8 TaxID=3064386 RepID=UPI00273DB690
EMCQIWSELIHFICTQGAMAPASFDELFAGIAYAEINGYSQVLIDKLERAKQTCLTILESENNYKKAALINTNIHYSCWLLIFSALHYELKERGSSIFQLWKAFQQPVEQGNPVTPSTFIDVTKPYISHELWLNLSSFVRNTESSSRVFFNTLATNQSMQMNNKCAAEFDAKC